MNQVKPDYTTAALFALYLVVMMSGAILMMLSH